MASHNIRFAVVMAIRLHTNNKRPGECDQTGPDPEKRKQNLNSHSRKTPQTDVTVFSEQGLQPVSRMQKDFVRSMTD